MTAAQNIADQGFRVHLVEQESSLGGLLRSIHTTLEQIDVQDHLRRMIVRTMANPRISVQTGTTHGGVVLPDGSIAKVELDFKTLEVLSQMVRDSYGMAGAVQHGASSLPEAAFGMFAQAPAFVNTAGFQPASQRSTS